MISGIVYKLFEKNQGEHHARWAKLSHSGQLLTAMLKLLDQEQQKITLLLQSMTCLYFEGRNYKAFNAFRRGS